MSSPVTIHNCIHTLFFIYFHQREGGGMGGGGARGRGVLVSVETHGENVLMLGVINAFGGGVVYFEELY
jgi:hypothetical protein